MLALLPIARLRLENICLRIKLKRVSGNTKRFSDGRTILTTAAVGVSNEEIMANKGPPMTSIKERMIMVGAVKWVDENIPEAPSVITEEFRNMLFNDYNIDYIIHADDPCLLPDGTDSYTLAKKQNA